MRHLWFETALLPGGWARSVRIALRDGRIAAVEVDAAPAPGDARGGIALPGLPNLHSHAFQRGMAGLAERPGPVGDDFWTWREVMYRFLDRMDPDDVEAVAAQAYAEMLEAGFTRVGEFHYLHHDRDGRPYAAPGEMIERIAAAAAETGIAATLLPCFYAHGGVGGAPPNPGQRRFVSDFDGFADLVAAARRAAAGLEGGAVGLAPHSLRAATPDEIARVLPLAEGGPVHVHAAEQVREVEECLAATGRRPVELLLAECPVDAHWCLIHATHVTAAEVAGLAASGAVAGLCPMTEASLGDGVFPAEAYLAAGGRLGVGTDSNVLIAAAEEMRLLEYAQRLTLRRRNVLAGGPAEGGASRERSTRPSTGRRLFDACLAGGTRALGTGSGSAPGSVPGLAPGRPADLVALDPEHAALAGRAGDALLDAWIFAARTNPVARVWRAGRLVVEDGRHVRAEAIARRFRTALAGLADAV